MKIPASDWTEYTIRSRKFNASATNWVRVSSRPQNSLKLLINYLILFSLFLGGGGYSVLKGENRHRSLLKHKTNVIRGSCFCGKISKLFLEQWTFFFTCQNSSTWPCVKYYYLFMQVAILIAGWISCHKTWNDLALWLSFTYSCNSPFS